MEHWKHIPVTARTEVRNVLAPYFTRRQISRLKQKQGILKNGRPVRTNETVQPGDTVSALLYEDQARPVPFPVLYEDEHLLAIHKPAGMVCHASPGHETDSIQSQLPGLYLTGRLDKDTSGILLFAKYPAALSHLQVRKTYQAIVPGFSGPLPFVVDVPLKTVTENRHSRTMADAGGRPAKTTILRQEGSLLTMEIEHGRMHQIRVHLAYAGFPILGDPLYGAGEGPHTMLHCGTCRFVHPDTKKEVIVHDPLPEDFLSLLEWEG